MSSSINSNFSEEDSSPIRGFTYGLEVSSILLLMSTITFAFYFCIRNDGTPAQSSENQQEQQRNNDHVVIAIEGIDEDTLKTYPMCRYSQLNGGNNKNDLTANCCSICLADYEEKDVIRKLPKCEHVFHQKCVDPWLMLHPTCPVCRASPLPTPQSTPFVEVAPLAMDPPRM